ncbi:MAG: hypothetical protein CL570_02550 [Alphaproteobacteria bacterium]|nr:hypothetical protein [Alphaproteobacteria bacterium]|tara:strand:+ start:2657 stop:3289 length:633 start_codon:yes stop_codon:yes gene_type:complete
MPNDIPTGDKRPLNVSKQGNHRFFCGLGWDPSQAKGAWPRLKEILSGRKSYHDLDLSCFLYDNEGKFVDVISGKIGKIVDQSGGIYHSGDDHEGIGDGDDEQISVELKNLAADICHIVFKISIDSGHKFGEIESPAVRLVDAYSNRHFLQIDLSQPEAADSSSYIMAEIYRTTETPDDWQIHFINEYITGKTSVKWKKKITEFLSLPTEN